MKFIQSLLFLLAALVGLLVAGTLLVNSAAASQAAPLVAEGDQCQAPCSVGQGLELTILPPGVTPPTAPPTVPPTTPPPTSVPADDGGPGGKGGTTATPPKDLPRTGPKETAIAAVIGLLLLQAGLMMSVRTARAVPRKAH